MDKILVNAVLHPDGLRHLEECGYLAVVVPEEDPEGSRRAAAEAVGVAANASLPFDDAFFTLAPRLKVIGRVGVGYDNVDLEAARRRGIRVVNTPLSVIEPVAEHTFALFLGLTRRIPLGDRTVREGRWRQPENMPGPELRGKTLGLVGFGNTGRRVAEIAAAAFAMPIIYADLVARPEEERRLGARRLSLEELFAAADFISIHVNLTPATRGLIGAPLIALMKPTAFLVNLSRGPVVDEAALCAALAAGRIAGAGLDVYQAEPPGGANPLLKLPNVVLSPHIGGASIEGKRGSSMVVLDIVRVLRGEEPRHPVV
jgi:phosphoglycerate dehydrogenase-like enzyme